MDTFSRTLRELTDNASAVTAQSTLRRQDFYGNTETWVVDTFRVDGDLVVLLQRSGVEPLRLVLPAEVTAAISRHESSCLDKVLRRNGRDAAARRKAAGLAPGFASNPGKGGRRPKRARRRARTGQGAQS